MCKGFQHYLKTKRVKHKVHQADHLAPPKWVSLEIVADVSADAYKALQQYPVECVLEGRAWLSSGHL